MKRVLLVWCAAVGAATLLVVHADAAGRLGRAWVVAIPRAMPHREAAVRPVAEPVRIEVKGARYLADPLVGRTRVTDGDIDGALGPYAVVTGSAALHLQPLVAHAVRGLAPARFVAYRVRPTRVSSTGMAGGVPFRSEAELASGWELALAPSAGDSPELCPYLRDRSLEAACH